MGIQGISLDTGIALPALIAGAPAPEPRTPQSTEKTSGSARASLGWGLRSLLAAGCVAAVAAVPAAANAAAISGLCGLAAGVPVSAAPSSGLCEAGTASAVNGTGPWHWQCVGSGGGTTAACGALLASNSAQTFTYDLVRNFGAATNNVAATDAALKAFNAKAIEVTQTPGAMVVLTIPAGTFTYSWNQFVIGVRRLKIVGAGSGLNGGSQTILQNTNGDGNWFDEQAIHGNWDYFGDGLYSWDNFGWLINTASSGATSVVLNDPAGTAHFAVGRWVLVMSYVQQQYGYPPDMRYYDWAVVTAIDSTTGTISFDTPLNFTHLSNRPYDGAKLTEQNHDNDSSGQVGPAAIVPIDTAAKPITEYLELDGLRVLQNANFTLGDPNVNDVLQLSGMIDGKLNDVWFDDNIATTQIRNLTIANSEWAYDESDKIVNNLVYQQDQVGESHVHAGQLAWQVLGGTIGPASVSAMNALFEGATLTGASSAADYYAGIQLDVPNLTRLVVADHSTFVGGASVGGAPISGPQSGPMTIKIGSHDVSLPQGPGTSEIQIVKKLNTLGSPSEEVVDNWGDGEMIMKNGAFVPGAQIASITGNANYIFVTVNGTTFQPGDTVYAARDDNLSVTNNVGQNTGWNWSDPAVIPHENNIPAIVWSGNSGD